MKYIHKLSLLLSTALLYSCSNSPLVETKLTPEIIKCTNPRPQICTMDYSPVCATRDTGVRCVTTPCPSTETATYSNGCSACSDPKVLYYTPGECK